MALELDPSDPDYVSPEERAALEVPQPPETPPAKPAPEDDGAKERARLTRVLQQRQQSEERLKESLSIQAQELQRLREENAAIQARQSERDRLRQEQDDQLRVAKRAAERPDPEIDPLGAQVFDMRHELSELRDFRQAVDRDREAARMGWEQQQAQQRAVQDVGQFLDADVRTFKEEHEDYDAAAQYVLDKYAQPWRAAGLTEQEVATVLGGTFMALGQTARVKQKSPASVVYQHALDLGYKANGTPAQRPANQQRTATDIIKQQQRAQQLQGLGGKTPQQNTPAENVGGMSAEDIANLSDDDFLRMKQDPVAGPLLEARMRDLG